MSVGRLAILGIALLAGIGAFVLMMMNNGGEEPVVRIIEPTKEKTVRVLVATRDLQRGERLLLEDTNWISWPKNAVQPTFITDETPDVREGLERAVARSLIVTGEPIVEAKMVRPERGGMMAAILTPGMRAITLRVSPEIASGGFILPGDRVDLLHTLGDQTRVAFSDVRVLAVDTIYAENTENAVIQGSNMTFEMSPPDAQTFISRREQGRFSVVLRSIFQPETELKQKKSSDVTVIRYGRS